MQTILTLPRLVRPGVEQGRPWLYWPPGAPRPCVLFDREDRATVADKLRGCYDEPAAAEPVIQACLVLMAPTPDAVNYRFADDDDGETTQ